MEEITLREKVVIDAFINVVKTGQRTYDYAVTMIEDEKSFGYLTPKAKSLFYEEFLPKEEPIEPLPEEMPME